MHLPSLQTCHPSLHCGVVDSPKETCRFYITKISVCAKISESNWLYTYDTCFICYLTYVPIKKSEIKSLYSYAEKHLKRIVLAGVVVASTQVPQQVPGIGSGTDIGGHGGHLVTLHLIVS